MLRSEIWRYESVGCEFRFIEENDGRIVAEYLGSRELNGTYPLSGQTFKILGTTQSSLAAKDAIISLLSQRYNPYIAKGKIKWHPPPVEKNSILEKIEQHIKKAGRLLETAEKEEQKQAKNIYQMARKLFLRVKDSQETKSLREEIDRGLFQLALRKSLLRLLPSVENQLEFNALVDCALCEESFLTGILGFVKAKTGQKLDAVDYLIQAIAFDVCLDRNISGVVENYLLLSTWHHQQRNFAASALCIQRAFKCIRTVTEDPLAIAHFLENLDRNQLIELNINLPSSSKIEEILLKKDAVRMNFEDYLQQLNRLSSQKENPTCFICFTMEKNVGHWLEQIFVPDLDKIGVKPLFCFRDFGPGKDLNVFQELARTADFLVVICTPAIKQRCEERKKLPIGVAMELNYAVQRFNDTDKYETIFPVYLKGNRKDACPRYFLEDILGTKFNDESSVLAYYFNAFELFAPMRGVPREIARQIREEFIRKITEILALPIDRTKVDQWRGKKESEIQGVRQAVEERVSAKVKVVNLPLPVNNFTGREKELQELHDACKDQHRVAITGLGGIGKTALAIKYGNNYKAHYQFIHFMPAGSAQLVIRGLLKLADDLYVEKTERIEERLNWLKITLSRLEYEYLLIFDGVDEVEAFQEIEKYLPERGHCILLTSRMPEQSRIRGFQIVEMPLFSIEEAVNYLLQATGSNERENANLLAEKLGRLPLALTHAAGYIRSRKFTMEQYMEEFDRHQVGLFEEKYLTLTTEEKTILTTWKASLDAIEQAHNCSLDKEILNLFAFLGQAPIPLELIEHWFTVDHPSENELEFENALRLLFDYSMVDSPHFKSYGIHPLVSKVICYQMDKEEQNKYLKMALNSLFHFLKRFDKKQPSEWSFLRKLMPHCAQVAWLIQERITDPGGEETFFHGDQKTFSFFSELGRFLENEGLFDGALANLNPVLQLLRGAK